MTVLLNLNDCIDEIVEQRAIRSEKVTYPSTAHCNTDPSDDEYQRMLSNYEEFGRKLLASRTKPTTLPTPTVTSHTHLSSIQRQEFSDHSTSHSAPDTMVSIRDIAMLQRREFKIHGGQTGDSVSDIRFSNLCKQIDEGIKEGYTESEIIRGVLRIKPGNFKDVLIPKDDMTVAELKSFLQSHLGESSSTELFQELMTAKQHDHETPQQFLYRMISLKQKILFSSRQVNSDIRYDDQTVQSVFIHTVSQGIGLKHSDIRRELRPFLSDSTVSDETLLRHVIRITSDESERQCRLGQSTCYKVAHAHSAQFESDSGAKEMVRVDETTKDKIIQQLKVQIEALTTVVDSLKQSGTPKFPNSWHEYSESQPQRHQQSPQQSTFNFQHPTPFLPSAMPLYNPDTQVQSQTQCQSQHQYRSRPQTQFSSNKRPLQRQRQSRCHGCIDKNVTICSHCFICGAEGHRAGVKKPGKWGMVTAQGQPVIKVNYPSQYEMLQEPTAMSTLSKQIHNITSPYLPNQSNQMRVARLVGEKCLLKCTMNGYPVSVLLDTGAQVSIMDYNWKEIYLPHTKLRPLTEITDGQELEVRDVKKDLIPFHGWVEITLNLLGNEDPRLAIHVPFLVSRIGLERPILGFNVVQEIIKGGENRTQALFTLANLLSTAMEIEEDRANALINLIQYKDTSDELDLDIQVSVNVGPQDVVIHTGCVTHVKCRIPDNFNVSSPMVLFEPVMECPQLDQLIVGEGLLKIQNPRNPYVEIPVGN
ncbi:hypothetical protein QQF64_008991 [Cirrhinus molitorella]|uniref:Peptidase A2 domain-containing protein n=1 Tax=Cirrhinus molitorella TaxID=172907 RepID=A0ABR3MB35_9TELE